MTDDHPHPARNFAVEVVRRLRNAGFQAYWAGGCVRDMLLGIEPEDYDVATEARPEQVRGCFGHRRTLAVGAAFGVITVLGHRQEGQVEVATFRQDAEYSDGRHPDHVVFSSAQEDAQRRDFTINGLFFDPLTETVLDYVGGRADLARGVVRAIGDPYARFAEDRLRMLRAVRFTATYGFHLDAATLAAVQALAHSVVVVSAERIAAEMRRIATHERRRQGLALLWESKLAEVVLPELCDLVGPQATIGDSPAWAKTGRILETLVSGSFAAALAALLRDVRMAPGSPCDRITRITERWRLANHEARTAHWILEHEPHVRRARELPWSDLQPLLVDPRILDLLAVAEAAALVEGTGMASVAQCREQLHLPPEQLDPPPLINGDDLRALGLPRGPLYRELLHKVRVAQLDDRVRDKPAALQLIDELTRPSAGA